MKNNLIEIKLKGYITDTDSIAQKLILKNGKGENIKYCKELDCDNKILVFYKLDENKRPIVRTPDEQNGEDETIKSQYETYEEEYKDGEIFFYIKEETDLSDTEIKRWVKEIVNKSEEKDSLD